MLFANDARAAEVFGSTVLDMRFVAHDRIVKSALFALFIPVIGAATLMTGDVFEVRRLAADPGGSGASSMPLQMIWNVTGTMAQRDLSLMWMAYLQPALAAALTRWFW